MDALTSADGALPPARHTLQGDEGEAACPEPADFNAEAAQNGPAQRWSPPGRLGQRRSEGRPETLAGRRFTGPDSARSRLK